MIKTETVRELAQKTVVDEHGSIYHRSDDVYINVLDVVTKDKKKFFISGKFIALVEIERERTYSKAYTRQYGKGKRKDRYLVGTNETGTAFAHQVSDQYNNVVDALNWVWDGHKIVARHGDIGIIPATHIKHKQGVIVKNEQIIDAHVFSGEMFRNGAVYVKNGVLNHQKNQHPDIIVSNEWHRIIFAKRNNKGIGGTKD